MIVSIALCCSGVKSAAPTAPGSNSARSAPNPSAAARSEKLQPDNITETPVQRRPAASIVEILRLAVNVLGAEIGWRVLRQQLLGAIGLLRGVLFLAVGKRFLG